MILVDTSVWVDHLRAGNRHLARLLEAGQVVTHAFVLGELALGNLSNRQAVLDSLKDLPQVVAATDGEVLAFIESNFIYGRGIGYIDTHLLASVRLTPGSKLWTLDKRLHALSEEMKSGYIATR